MRIFVAGASGAVGKRLVPLLVRRGHHVIATTRTPTNLGVLEAMSAKPVLMDGLDGAAVAHAVADAGPDVVVHQMTALANVRSLRRFDHEFALTNRLRTDGTRLLLDAAVQCGAHRLVVQSFTGWTLGRVPGWVRTEEDPLEPHPPAAMRETLQAIRTLEQLVTSATSLNGVVLRYGAFYGPGTSLGRGGDLIRAVQARRLPVIGDGGGMWSFSHVDDVAEATALAIEGAPTGIYHVVDDEPATVATWLTELASILGAPPPWRVPSWVGYLALGAAGVRVMTETRGSSNAKAKAMLEWAPIWPSWRDGFRSGLG